MSASYPDLSRHQAAADDALRARQMEALPMPTRFGYWWRFTDLASVYHGESAAKMADDPGPRPKAADDDAVYKRIIELRKEKWSGDTFAAHEPWCSYRRPGVSSCDCGGAR